VTIQSADRSVHHELESVFITIIITIIIVVIVVVNIITVIIIVIIIIIIIIIIIVVVVVVITGRVHSQMCLTVRQNLLLPRWSHMPVPKTLPCLARIHCAQIRESLLSSSSSSSSVTSLT